MPEELTTPPVANTPPVEAPPAAPETPAAPPAEKPAIISELEQLGFVGVSDEKEALARVVAAYKQQKETLGNEIKQALAEVRQAPAVPQQQAPASNNGNWFNPPQVDKQLAARFRNGDGWKDGTPAEIRQQYEAYEAYRSDFANRLLDNPEQTLEPLLEKKFAEYFDRRYQQVASEQQERAYFDRALAENDWIFEKDPITGGRSQKLTAEGQQLNAQMIDLEQSGLPKHKAFELALKFRAAEKAALAARTTTPEQAAEISRQKQQELLSRASPPNSRAGSLPNAVATPPRNRNLSPGQKLLQELERAGGGVN